MIADVVHWAGLCLALLVLVHALPWLALSLLAIPAPGGRPGLGRPRRLAVLVPAHNEEALVGRCVRSILADAGAVQATVYVIADNCSDRTAEAAAAAGAKVLVRTDPGRRGKPYALDFALDHLRRLESPPGALVVVDGDSHVAPGFLVAMASALDRGGAAIQCHYRPDPGGTGVQRLRGLAFALAHWARPLGAARLGLGTTLKGNGMAFDWALCRDGLGWSGLAEDAGLTVDLAARGVAVRFEPRATVFGHMAGTYGEARTQDLRWESGRASLRRRALVVSLRAAAHGRVVAAAGALEVASLPLTRVAVLAVAAAACTAATGSSLVVPGVVVGAVVLAVLTGWVAARVPIRELLVLVEAPRFALHKLGVDVALATGRGPRGWERTGRG